MASAGVGITDDQSNRQTVLTRALIADRHLPPQSTHIGHIFPCLVNTTTFWPPVTWCWSTMAMWSLRSVRHCCYRSSSTAADKTWQTVLLHAASPPQKLPVDCWPLAKVYSGNRARSHERPTVMIICWSWPRTIIISTFTLYSRPGTDDDDDDDDDDGTMMTAPFSDIYPSVLLLAALQHLTGKHRSCWGIINRIATGEVFQSCSPNRIIQTRRTDLFTASTLRE